MPKKGSRNPGYICLKCHGTFPNYQLILEHEQLCVHKSATIVADYNYYIAFEAKNSLMAQEKKIKEYLATPTGQHDFSKLSESLKECQSKLSLAIDKFLVAQKELNRIYGIS